MYRTTTLLLCTLLVSSPLQAQVVGKSSSAELQCRSKAKEIAAETYRGCITEQKTAQIEEIKKQYQERIRQLKAEYEAELKAAAGNNSKKVSKTQNLPDESVMDIPDPIPVETN